MTTRPGRDSDRLLVRFPDGMKVKIEKAAAANGRSLNAEVVARLERSFSDEVEAASTDRLTRGFEQLQLEMDDLRKLVTKELRK